MNTKTLSLLIILLGLVAISGCSGGEAPDSEEVSTPTPTVSPETEETVTPAPTTSTPEPTPETKRFSSSEWNFSFEYPRDWELTVTSNTSDAFRAQTAFRGGSFSAEAKKTVPMETGVYAEQFADGLKSSQPYQDASFSIENGTIVEESKVVNIDGITEEGDPITRKERAVITVRQGEDGFIVYTLAFSQTETGFDQGWENDFKPLLESFGTGVE